MIVACFVLAFFLVCSVAMNLAQANDLDSESTRADHWRSMFEGSSSEVRDLREKLADARKATAKALGQGTRMAKMLHEAEGTIAASEEALAKAAELIADLKLAQLAVEAQSKRTVPHNDGGAN